MGSGLGYISWCAWSSTYAVDSTDSTTIIAPIHYYMSYPYTVIRTVSEKIIIEGAFERSLKKPMVFV